MIPNCVINFHHFGFLSVIPDSFESLLFAVFAAVALLIVLLEMTLMIFRISESRDLEILWSLFFESLFLKLLD